MIPDDLAEQVKKLQALGRKVTVSDLVGGFYHVIEEDHALPKGYNKAKTRILVKAPASYPNGNPDMFWTDPDLTLENGNRPDRANPEDMAGQAWLRFSWHPSKWNPGSDDLLTYFEFVERRLLQVK